MHIIQEKIRSRFASILRTLRGRLGTLMEYEKRVGLLHVQFHLTMFSSFEFLDFVIEI